MFKEIKDFVTATYDRTTLFVLMSLGLLAVKTSCDPKDNPCPPHEYNIVKKNFCRAVANQPSVEELQYLLDNGNEYGRIDLIKLIPAATWNSAVMEAIIDARRFYVLPFMDEPRVTGYGRMGVPQLSLGQAVTVRPNIIQEFEQFGWILYSICDQQNTP